MQRPLRLVWLSFFLVSCGGSGGGDAGTDATPPDAGYQCIVDDECDDGDFCNGRERCNHTFGADSRGCLAAAMPACQTTQVCDPVAHTCTTNCMVRPDADGDGHASVACGGDDCDDTMASVHPGATEICDPMGDDEDCNPATLAGPTDGDQDGDGYVRAACCDTQPGGALLCGTDCDDHDAAVHPGATEICNRVDDDCNGVTDDGAMQALHVDADHDGYGDPSTSMLGPCVPPLGLTTDGTDCNDHDMGVHPGAREICDGVDQSCDGIVDEGCADGTVTITAGDTGPMPVGTGAIFFHDVCASGSVLVGLALASDATRAGALCAPLSVAIDTSTTPYVPSFATGAVTPLPEHGATTTTSPSTCAAGELISQIGIGLRLTCATFAVGGATGSLATMRGADAETIGPGTGEPMGLPYRCPDDSVGIGVAGYEVSGTFAITGLTCGRVVPGMIAP